MTWRMRLPIDFWLSTPIQPIPTLSALRDMVLARSTKRMPKWKFRLADHTVVQIQPQPVVTPFRCHAVIREAGAEGSLLATGNRRPPDSWYIKFDISDDWRFKARRVGFHRDYPRTDIWAVRDSLIETLPAVLGQLRPSAMLRPACLCCGKELTDPVSMARWIGPECFGTASNNLPFLVSPFARRGGGMVDTGKLRFFMMDDGRVIERDHEPEGWYEGYHSLAEMREALMAPNGFDEAFREKLITLVEELANISDAVQKLRDAHNWQKDTLPW